MRGGGLFLIFCETKLKGAFIIELERLEDERGFFARTFCQEEFEAHGLNARIVQCNISFNKRKGTLRGMHYQVAPYEEAKLVRCTKGAIYDVIIDLRPDSLTFRRWIAVELTADNRFMLYVPADFAHGFQTLEDNTEVFYQMSEFYHPECARGVRWDDPAFAIEWPMVPITISEKDEAPLIFDPRRHSTMTTPIDQEFQEKVITTLRAMKFEPAKRPDELAIPVYQQGNVVVRLHPIHANFTPEEVQLLVEWRNQNSEAFLTWITATEEGTKKWLTERILSRDDRILFFVETLDGVPFGHIGLTNFDFSLKACEIDNVIRGKAELNKGGMTFAFQTLMNWVFFFLDANSAYLRVFSNNERALRFYIRNGFRMVRQVPLRRVEEGNMIRWVESEEDNGSVFEKYVVYLKTDRNEHARRLNQ